MADEEKVEVQEEVKEEVQEEKPAKKGKGKAKGKGKGKKPTKESAKKNAKKKKDGVVEVKHSKAYPDREINAYTGTRYKRDSSGLRAFEIVLAGAKEGKTVKEIRKELANYRKANGCDRNLDSGYFPFVVATHPEFFQVVRKDGEEYVEVLKEPVVDEAKVKELDEKEEKKKKAREARKKKVKDKPSKKSKPKKKPSKKAKKAEGKE